MKRLMISAFAVVALLAAAATILRSHATSTEPTAGTAAIVSLQGLRPTMDVSKLPIEEFEDQSLVYSKPAR